jgi:hypothetical protein
VDQLAEAADSLRRAVLEPGASAEASAAAVESLVRDQPAKKAAAILVKAVGSEHPDILGYGVFAPIRSWFGSKEGLAAGAGLLGERHPTDFRLVLVDYLDAGARVGGGTKAWWASARRLAADEDEPAELRMRAVRALRRDDSGETQALLRNLASGPVRELAAEATLVLAQRGDAVSSSVSVALWDANPDDVPLALLRAADTLGEEESGTPVARLLNNANSPEARARIVGAAASAISSAELAKLLLGQPSGQVAWALRALLLQRPALLDALEVDGNNAALLAAAALLTESGDDAVERRLLKLARGSDGVAADAAALLDPSALPAKARRIRIEGEEPQDAATIEQALIGGDGRPERNGKPDPESHHSPGPPDPPGAPFSTGLHVADGVYRDLILPQTHWHAGLYLGFTADSPTLGMGEMTGINAAQGIGWSDTMAFFQASASFASPAADVATTMKGLLADFVVQFQEGHTDKTFHGARRPNGLTAGQRLKIAATGASLFAKNIWWTWVDMLDYKWFDWDGSVNDIDESRCDGVIEYSYEANDVRVCGGIDAARWNISTPGTANVENHNDFHNGNYQPGELCPRIQAGDRGDSAHAPAADTTFASGAVTPPAVQDFAAYGFAFIFVPSIWFRVATADYLTAFVRITVRKDSGPWHFVRTEDPYGGAAPPALTGDWRFKQVRTNTTGKLFGFWMGKTTDGMDFRGQNGTYTFRIVAVDPAGNVSAAVTTSTRVDWPPPPATRIQCVNKPRRESADEHILAVGGVRADGSRWKLSQQDAIRRIEAGDRFYVEEPTGDRVGVIVALSRYGNKYLKTIADGDVPNNLLALPECP